MNKLLSDVTVLLAIFSLGWFVVGILAGQQIPSRPRRKKSSRRNGRQGARNSIELYVGNLSYDIKGRDLHKTFSKYGKIISARVIENKFNGKSKGFGFVEIDGKEASGAAIKALNGKAINGRNIVVNEARSNARS